MHTHTSGEPFIAITIFNAKQNKNIFFFANEKKIAFGRRCNVT
jgi:hypothetical protein